MRLDIPSLLIVALITVILVISIWWGAKRVKFWNSLRRFDRRQRVTPTATLLTWTIIAAGFTPFAYQMVELSIPFLIGAMGFFVGVNLVAVYLSNTDWYSAHTTIDRTDIHSIDYGKTIVTGTVTIPDNQDDENSVETITAPVSQNECVAYLSSINESRWLPNSRRHISRSTTATLALDENTTPFYLTDDTGNILVDPSGMDILLSAPTQPFLGSDHSTSRELASGESLPEHLQAYENDLGVETHASRTRRYNEARIAPGDEVYVLGECQQISDKKYPSRETRVIKTNENPGILVQEPYENIDDSIHSLKRYYGYGGAAAAGIGYVIMVFVSLI